MDRKNLIDILVGSSGIILVTLSRGFFPDEVTSIVGSDETKVLLEHFITHYSIGTFAQLPKNIFKNEDGKFITYILLPGIISASYAWEKIQANSRGFFQWDQFVSASMGVCAAYVKSNFGLLKETIKKYL